MSNLPPGCTAADIDRAMNEGMPRDELEEAYLANERLRALNEELIEALRIIARTAHDYDQTGPNGDYRFSEIDELAGEALAKAREVKR